MDRRRVKIGSKPHLQQVSSDFIGNTDEERFALVSSSSSGVKSRNSERRVVSDEIICINKESNSEALVALTAGFPSDSLIDEEIEAGVVSVVGGIEQYNYILIRNHIITKWCDNVSIWVMKDMFVDVIPEHCCELLYSTYNYLLSYGYINFGVLLAIKDKIPAEPSKGRVIVIGAGLSRLAAAKQLMSFDFEVIVLEGRKRAGGRVYTKKMEGGNEVAAADLGGSALTGTLGNPLDLLARQLSYTLHKVRDQCPLYRVDRKPVDEYLDKKVEAAYNRLLDKASKLRQELSQAVSLGATLETLRKDSGVAMNDEEAACLTCYATVAGEPLLIALVSGEAAHKFEIMAPTDAVTKVLQILKGIYEPQGINVPEPIQIVFTRWGSDPFRFGSYSNVAVGASGDDCGAGKADFSLLVRRLRGAIHGAFLTGLREAAKIAHHASVRHCI